MPVNQTLFASRNATWAPTLTYDYRGPALPLAGGRIDMQVRLYPGQPDAAKLTLSSIPFADALLSGTAGGQDEVRRLTLSPAIAPGAEDGSTPNTLRALPGLHEPEAGEPLGFAFDILITYADGLSEVLSSGQFIVSPGVTVA